MSRTGSPRESALRAVEIIAGLPPGAEPPVDYRTTLAINRKDD